MKKISGFTIVEMIIVIVTLGILVAIGNLSIRTGLDSYFASQDLQIANAQARLALEQMARNIHAVRSVNDITTANASQFTFVDTNGNTNSYTLSGTTLNYTLNANPAQPLAQGVSSLTFSYLGTAGTSLTIPIADLTTIRYVTAELVITLNSVNYTLRTTINPRNLNQS